MIPKCMKNWYTYIVKGLYKTLIVVFHRYNIHHLEKTANAMPHPSPLISREYGTYFI